MAAGKGEGPAIGIDLGMSCSCVGVCQHDQGNRTTPSYVAAFTHTERFTAGKDQVTMNPINTTVFDAEGLIRRRFTDAPVQSDMKLKRKREMESAIDDTIVGIRDMGETYSGIDGVGIDMGETCSCIGIWPDQNILTRCANTTKLSPSVTPTNPHSTIDEGSDILLAKVDGYWNMDEQGRIVSGIGGFIKDTKSGQMRYIFALPVTCDSSRAAQIAAISHIVGAIIDNHDHMIGREIQVHLDAREVVKDITNKSIGHLKLEKELEEIDDQIKKIPRLKLMHIPRESHQGADGLAKRGSENKITIATWI